MDHGIQTFGVEVHATTKGECGRWPFGVVNRMVSQKDVAG